MWLLFFSENLLKICEKLTENYSEQWRNFIRKTVKHACWWLLTRWLGTTSRWKDNVIHTNDGRIRFYLRDKLDLLTRRFVHNHQVCTLNHRGCTLKASKEVFLCRDWTLVFLLILFLFLFYIIYRYNYRLVDQSTREKAFSTTLAKKIETGTQAKHIGACMLDRSRASATCARLSQFFLAS